MIDKTKNVCYVIWVNYWSCASGNKEICKRKFLSQYQFSSKRFTEFLDKYFKTVPDFDGFYNGDLGSQSTISRSEWQQVKDEVLEGISEKEKCY